MAGTTADDQAPKTPIATASPPPAGAPPPPPPPPRFRVDQPSPCSRLPPLRAARPEVRGPSKSGLL